MKTGHEEITLLSIDSLVAHQKRVNVVVGCLDKLLDGTLLILNSSTEYLPTVVVRVLRKNPSRGVIKVIECC